MKRFHSPLVIGANKLGLFLASLLFAATSPADNFTTCVDQPYAWPPFTWNDAIWQPGTLAPTAGNAYEVLDGGLVRNPPDAGVQTFPGDSLVLDVGARINAKGPSGTTLNFPGTDGSPGLILRGGKVQAADDQTFTIAGRIWVASDSFIDHHSGARSFMIVARIEGEGSLTLINGGDTMALDIRSEQNPYSGGWSIREGYLRGTGNGSLGTGNITIGSGATLEIDYDIRSPGSLTLLGGDSVMVLHQDCQFSAVTINNIPLTPGCHDYAGLVAQFPGNFADGGWGSITVGPLADASADPIMVGQEASSQSSATVEEVTDAATSVDTGVSGGTLHLVPVGVIDTTAPVVAMGIIVAADSPSQMTIRWNASTDSGGSGIAGYKIFRGATLLGTTTATSYTDSGLSPGMQCCYTIVAYDSAGNAAARSPQSCAMTPATPLGLVAAYSFDEGNGTEVLDSSVNGNDGTIDGATWTSAGQYGKGLVFNGTNALVRIGDSDSLHLTTGMTLEAWVNPSAVSNKWQDVIFKGNDNYYLEASSTLNALPGGGGIFNSDNVVASGIGVLAVDTWTHLAVTYDMATLRFYVNGVQVGSRSQTGSILTSANPLQIGGDDFFGQYFQGTIDEVRVYNVALTAEQIQSDMNTPIGDMFTDTEPPTTPSGVVATANSDTKITLQWNASTDVGGSGVWVYRVFRNGVLRGLAVATSYTDSGLTPNTQYCYTVDAFDLEKNRSSASAETCATTLVSSGTPLATPSNLAVVTVATDRVTLSWQDNSSDEVGFRIDRASSADGPWAVAGITSGANVTSYTDSGLTPSVTYYYRVSAYN